MKTTNWPNRLYALDVSRGIAALSVVLWHWHHFAYVGTSLPETFDTQSQPFYNLLAIFYEKGGMGVDYFFILSGFIFFWLFKDPIKNKVLTGKQFAVQRFSRLYPLHFATLIVVAILQYIQSSQNGQFFVYQYNDLYHFILNLGFATKWGLESGHSFNAPVWSVSVEILLYVIFFIVAFNQRGQFKYCLGVSILAVVLYFIFRHPFLKGLSHFFLGGGVFYFTSWVSAKGYSIKRAIYIATVIVWLMVLANYYYYEFSQLILENGAIGKIILLAFPSFVLFPLTIVSLTLLEIDKNISLRSLAWIGDITYSSYLLHFPLQLIFSLAVTAQLLQRDFFQSPIYIVVFFVVLILISVVTFNKFEMPLQRLIRRCMR